MKKEISTFPCGSDNCGGRSSVCAPVGGFISFPASAIRVAFLAALIAGFFFPAIHLSAQAFDPTLIEGAEKTDREKREDAEAEAKRKAENEARRKKMMDDYWIRLNPGVLISNTSIRIIGQGARSGSTATMVSKSGFGKPDWMLDLKTKDYPLSEHWGIHLLAHTRSFDLNNQRYEQTISADDGSSSSETVQEDLGTRMRGYYALTVPVLYYNFNGREEGFRLGFGYGPSVVRIQGTASLDSGITNAPLFLSRDRDTLVRNLQLNTIVQGAVDFTRGDPVYGSLLLGLTETGGLERMGLYLAARGEIKSDLYTLFLVNYLVSGQAPGGLQLSVPEAVGAVGLANLNVDFREDFAPSYFLHGEYVWEHFTIRVALGGPIFTRGGFKYDFTGFILSASIPIRF